MQTLDEFIRTWNGKKLEVAGSANALNQCVDLANGYIRDVLGLPIIEWTDAVNFPAKKGSLYTYIKNVSGDLTNFPLKGDLVIWGQPYGRYTDNNGKVVYAGHIAVCLNADGNKITSFDQNFGNNLLCRTVEHDYTGVIGWMRPNKESPSEYTITIPQTERNWLISRATVAKELAINLKLEGDPDTVSYDKYEKSIEGLRSLSKALQTQLSEAQAEVKNREEQVNRIKQTYEASANTQQSRIDGLETAQKAWEKEREILKAQVTQFATDKGKLVIELEQTQTKLQQAVSGSTESLTLGDVILLLWNKVRFVKLK